MTAILAPIVILFLMRDNSSMAVMAIQAMLTYWLIVVLMSYGVYRLVRHLQRRSTALFAGFFIVALLTIATGVVVGVGVDHFDSSPVGSNPGWYRMPGWAGMGIMAAILDAVPVGLVVAYLTSRYQKKYVESRQGGAG